MRRVFMLLGGLVGPDGLVLAPVENSGMLAIAADLKLKSCDMHTETWDQWTKFIPLLPPSSNLQPLPEDKYAVIGYSGGGSRATYLANATPAPHIDLLVLIDPSPRWQMHNVGGNVGKVLLVHNNLPMGSLGGGAVTGPNVQTIEVTAPHLLVPELPNVHTAVIDAVMGL